MADNKENVSITDSANDSQTSVTESQIMSESVHSTPVPTKRTDENEIVKMMQTLFNIQNAKFDEKFNEQKSEIREIQNNFNVKFNEMKNEIKK